MRTTKSDDLFITPLPIGLGILSASSVAAQAASPDGLPAVLVERLLPELAGLFVVATVMESALTTLFNWRLYRELFNGRAVKTLIMIIFGYMIVAAFQYDVFHRIVSFSGGGGAPSWESKILSALVLAGGSAAVYELFKALGLRAPVDPTAERAQPPENKAWVSVFVLRQRAIGDVRVHIEKIANPTQDELAKPPIAGVLKKRTIGERLRDVFTTNPMRYPPSGGRTVDAGADVYRITLSGLRKKDSNDGEETFAIPIFVGRFAGRAIVDLVHTI